MPRNAKRYMAGVRRAEGSPPEGEGRVGPGRMASVGSRFISELFNPKKAAEDVENVGRSYLDMLSAYNTFLYQRSPEEQAAFVASLPSKAREALGSAATTLRNLPQTAERAVKEATPESTAAAVRRYGVESALDPTRLVKGAGPVTSQIVRPRGEGIVLDAPEAPPVPYDGNAPRAPTGYVPRAIKAGQERLASKYPNLPQEHKDAITTFLNRNVRNYYTKQFGTQDDPIYKAIREGRIGSRELGAPGGIRKYLTEVAKEGKTRVDPETGESRFFPTQDAKDAIEDINRLYDRMTGMGGTVLTNQTVGDPQFKTLMLDSAKEELRRLESVTRDRLLAERLRPEEINPSMGYMGYAAPGNVQPNKPVSAILGSGGSSAKEDIQALRLSKPEFLPKEIRTAIEKGQPIYDMSPREALRKILDEKSLVDYLATLSPAQIKNLRYDDAIRGSVRLQAMKDEHRINVDRVRENKPVNNEIFSQGVSAPLVSYPEGNKLQGYTWRRIETPEATELEGAYIKHSVGGYADEGSYSSEKKKAFRAGTTQIYSLRDPRGMPVTTVEVENKPDFGPVVTQIRGVGRATGNTSPSELDAERQAIALNYLDPALIDLFDKLNVYRIDEYRGKLTPKALGYQKSLETYGGRGERPIQQGIGQLPQPAQPPDEVLRLGEQMREIPMRPASPQNPGFIEAMRRRLLGDQD